MATIIGTDIGETLDGTSDDDAITGLGGDDILNGNDGDDELEGGAGDDTLDGGDGDDTASYAAAAGSVTVDLRILGGQDTVSAGIDTLIGIENLTGSDHADLLYGNSGANILTGGGGNDTLTSLDGAHDVLRGGAGGDSYAIGHADVTIDETDAFNGSDVDTVFLIGALGSYTLGANLEALNSQASVGGTLVGNDQGNLIEGSNHNDVIVGGLGDDVLDGRGGVDTLDYSGNVGSGVTLALSTAFATATGGAGTDTVVGFENVNGSDFADLLTGNGIANELTGNGGADTLSGLGGNDILRGGAGNDELDGGANDDFLYGDGDDDILDGGDGDDHLDGGSGNDQLFAGSGVNSLEGGDGNDLLVGGANSDILLGGDGDDTLDPGATNSVEITLVDQLDGGAGVNTLSYATRSRVVTVTLNNGTATVATASANSTFVNFRNLTGTDLALPSGNAGDTLSGDEHSNHIRGLAGDDVLWGGSGGADILEGGEDGDFYIVDTAEDLDNVIIELAGARGFDFIRTALASYTLAFANVEGIIGSNAAGQALTGNENDNIVNGFDGDDILSGLGGNDSLGGGAGDDELDGGEGDDTLSGDGGLGSGNDVLRGGVGNDTLIGEGGNDTLDGGAGADTMTGGTGNDIYIVDDAGDVVSETGSDLADEVRTSLASYILPTQVERLVYTGTAVATLRGNSLGNSLTGGDADDIFLLQDGGDDSASGGVGADGFYLGGALNALDSVDGGEGNDQLAIQGNYNLTLAAATLTGIETLAILSGTNGEFGDPGGTRYDYRIVTHDANVAGGQNLIVNANGLIAGEDLIFDGSAESDGSFTIFAGFGRETLTGGQASDGFFFGEGRFSPNVDRIDGGAGADDQIGLRGDFSALLTFDEDTIRNIDTIALISAADTRYGAPGQSFSYNLETHDANVAAGQQLTVNGNGLAANEILTFDGSAETDGFFRIIAGRGADVLTGGAGSDLIFGGLGADQLTGNGGNDTFFYTAAAQSTAASRDTLFGFAAGDKIDLSAIDAVAGGANDAFTYIGSDAFSGAGQVRRVGVSGGVEYQADLDGDFNADLVIFVQGAGGYVPGGADLIL